MLSCFPYMIVAQTPRIEPAVAARFFRVLGDATRLRILRLLEDGERSVGELVAALDQPQPRVSTHLACLRHCGFVTADRRGREVFYGLALGGLAELLEGASTAAAPVAERLATCTRIGPEWV